MTKTTQTPDISNFYFWIGPDADEFVNLSKEEFEEKQQKERQIFDDWLNVRGFATPAINEAVQKEDDAD